MEFATIQTMSAVTGRMEFATIPTMSASADWKKERVAGEWNSRSLISQKIDKLSIRLCLILGFANRTLECIANVDNPHRWYGSIVKNSEEYAIRDFTNSI